MTDKLKILKGWKKLRRGSVIKRGDRFWSIFYQEWMLTQAQGEHVQSHNVYIRKVKP